MSMSYPPYFPLIFAILVHTGILCDEVYIYTWVEYVYIHARNQKACVYFVSSNLHRLVIYRISIYIHSTLHLLYNYIVITITHHSKSNKKYRTIYTSITSVILYFYYFYYHYCSQNEAKSDKHNINYYYALLYIYTVVLYLSCYICITV